MFHNPLKKKKAGQKSGLYCRSFLKGQRKVLLKKDKTEYNGNKESDELVERH